MFFRCPTSKGVQVLILSLVCYATSGMSFSLSGRQFLQAGTIQPEWAFMYVTLDLEYWQVPSEEWRVIAISSNFCWGMPSHFSASFFCHFILHPNDLTWKFCPSQGLSHLECSQFQF